MWFLNILILVFGLVALVKGADILVQKSVLWARYFSISPFFVGVVLLGMGTSAPEMAVSAFSSFKGLSHLAVGNVFGSNIFNILLVLGMLLFQPLSLEKVNRLKNNIWFLVLTGFGLGFFMKDLFLSRWEAFYLSLLFISYIILCLRATKTSPSLGHPAPHLESSFDFRGFFFWILLGIVLLAGGSQLTVKGAQGLGQSLGLSERIIGLLVVSTGTSLPELVASLVAILKKQKDMAIGNIVGSNVFNTFFVLSLSLWIRPASLESKMLTLDLPALWITHLLLLTLIFGYHKKWVKKALPYVFIGSYGVFLIALFFYPQ